MKSLRLNISLVLTLLLVGGGGCFAQLDSATVDFQLKTFVDINEFNDSITGKYYDVTIWVNDMDFFGEVVVSVYDNDLNYPVNKVKYTKTQLIDQGLIIGQEFTIPIYNIEEGRTYRFVTFIRDYQSNNIPIIENMVTAN